MADTVICRRRLRAVILGIGLLALFMTADSQGRAAPRPSPFAGKVLYRPDVQACEFRTSTSPDLAEAAAFVCDQPTARWIVDDMRSWDYPLRKELETAHASGTYAVLVLYGIPNRDCGLFSSQDSWSTRQEYLAWIESVAREIGTSSVAIIFEPDALAQAMTEKDCFTSSGVASVKERLLLMNQAVTILTENPETAVYIDAGNAAWAPAEEIARYLMKAGIEKAHGFALNVSSRVPTSDSIRYGKEVSSLIGNAGFVVDISRNGNPFPQDPGDWCNPDDEALGGLPTTATNDPLVHALLWVKAPGESDGECRRGDPPAGVLWPERLLLIYGNSQYSQ